MQCSRRIWRYDDQLHFRLLVKQDHGDQVETHHLDYFTIMLPISVTRLLPMALQPGMLVTVQATPIVREHPETLTTFLRTSADRDLFPRPEQADEITVSRRKVDFLAKMIVIRESTRPRRPAARRVVESPVTAPSVSRPLTEPDAPLPATASEPVSSVAEA